MITGDLSLVLLLNETVVKLFTKVPVYWFRKWDLGCQLPKDIRKHNKYHALITACALRTNSIYTEEDGGHIIKSG